MSLNHQHFLPETFSKTPIYFCLNEGAGFFILFVFISPFLCCCFFLVLALDLKGFIFRTVFFVILFP